MRLAVSNIAWPGGFHERALDLLAQHGATGLEIAPGIAFPEEEDPFAPSEKAVDNFRLSLDRRGLSLVSMQSLLFGVHDAQLFGDADQRRRLAAGLRRAIELAGRLGCPNLVMGSPANRAYPDTLTSEGARAQAREFFREIGHVCLEMGTRLAIEPNPREYGTNFLVTMAEAGTFVREVGHPAVTLNFDIGALRMTGEIADAGSLFATFAPHVSHVHISEPYLAPPPAEAARITPLVDIIDGVGYGGWFSIEMRADAADPLGQLASVLETVSQALHRLRVVKESPL